MWRSPSLMSRIAIGKLIGFGFGLFGLITLPWFLPDADWLLRWGLLLWYVTFGAIVGLMGAVAYHPMFGWRIPWWLRGPLTGAWLNFVLTFFVYDAMLAMMLATFGWDGAAQPFWFVLEGAVLGFAIEAAAYRFGGEGAAMTETG